MGRSAGLVLRSLRRLWEGWGFRAVREGILLFASKARYGPIPLRWVRRLECPNGALHTSPG